MTIMEYDRSVPQPSELTSTGYLLHLAGAEATRRWTRMLAERDLTPHQFGVLITLRGLESASQKELSAALGIDPRNAVPILDGLERRGLVERRPAPADRRRYDITLTPGGRRLAGELERAGHEIESELLAPLTDSERATLNRVLTKIAPPRRK